MLSPIAGTRVRHDDADVLLGYVEALREFGSYAERPLGPCPNGEFVARPRCHRGARLQRRMRDIRDRVRPLQFLVGLGHRLLDRSGFRSATIPSAATAATTLSQV